MAITMTEAAAKRVAALKKRRNKPEELFKVGVRGGGCSGLAYYVDFVDEAGPKDKVFEFPHDVKVVVDRKSYLFVNGTEIDFVIEKMKRSFIFNNPLAQGSCSCGESFAL